MAATPFRLTDTSKRIGISDLSKPANTPINLYALRYFLAKMGSRSALRLANLVFTRQFRRYRRV